MFNNKNYFDSNKSFFELKIVKNTGITIFTISTLISLIIFFNTDYTVCLTANCFNQFILDFRFPIGILALMIPIGALFAAEHRSKLTIAQIKSAESQNNFSNYFKHIEEFKKYIENADFDSYVTNINETHACIFGESKDTDFELSDDKINDIVRMIKHVYFHFRKMEVKIIKNSDYEYVGVCLDQKIYEEFNWARSIIEGVFSNLQISCSFLTKFKYDGFEVNSHSNSTLTIKPEFKVQTLIDLVKQAINILNYFLSFSTNYKKPPVFMCINSLEMNRKGNSYNFDMAKLEHIESSSRYSIVVQSDGIDEMIQEIDEKVVDKFGR